ncbi:hypothetical protein BH11BAC6_BH11BAC6_14300 [soil metagenome]
MFDKNYSRFIFNTCVILIITVKLFIRPYVHVPAFFQIVVDTLPNLLGSFCLPFGASWLLQKYFRLQNLNQLKLACLLSLGLVICNEYLQLIDVFGRTFDYFDIIASFIGTFASYFVYARLIFKLPAFDKYGNS